MKVNLDHDQTGPQFYSWTEAKNSGFSIFIDNVSPDSPLFITDEPGMFGYFEPGESCLHFVQEDENVFEYPLIPFHGTVRITN